MSTARKIVVFGGVVWAGLLVWDSSKEGRRRREPRDQLSRGFVSPSGCTSERGKRVRLGLDPRSRGSDACMPSLDLK